MANLILKVDISSGALDNVYSFFDDGSIERFYDANPHRLNITSSYSWDDLKGRSDLTKILGKCSESDKDLLRKYFPIDSTKLW